MLVDRFRNRFLALVDAKQELGLGRIGNQQLGKIGDAVLVEMIFGGVNLLEVFANRHAFQNFLLARRDDVVLDIDCGGTTLFHIGVDTRKPFLDTREILDAFGHGREILAGDTHIVVLVQHLHHQAHINQHRVRAGLDGLLVHPRPENFGLDTDFGQHCVFLHRLRRQRTVEVVHHGNGVLREGRERFLGHAEV